MASPISERFRSERLRLGLSHADVGDVCDVSRNSVMNWEGDTAIPVGALAALAVVGFDVQYVALGKRSENAPSSSEPSEAYLVEPTLSKEEWEVLRRYRTLSDQGKLQVHQMLKVIEMGAAPAEPKPTKVRYERGVRIAGRDYNEHRGKKK